MKFFRRPKPKPKLLDMVSDVEETQKVLDKQEEESEDTLAYIRLVLEKKDQLLAEAINQTGSAVRPRRRGTRHP